jgi:hypothetical protein
MMNIWKSPDAGELLQAHQFALVDRAVLLWQEWHTGLPLLPLENKALKASPEKLPALLPLTPDAPYMDALALNLEQTKEEPELRTACALLAVPEEIEPEQLQKHLTERLVAHLNSGKAYIRYFDPLVFPFLFRIIPPPRLHLLFGPIQCWSIPFQDEWISYAVPEVEHKATAWIFSDQQWERIGRILSINDVLMEYEVMQDRQWKSFAEYEQAGEIAERALSTAQMLYGIKDGDDLLPFGVTALAHGEHFHRHPHIQNLLRNPPPEGIGYALINLDESIWAQAPTHAHSNY